MITIPVSYAWLYWGLGLMLGLPLLVVLLGELAQWLERNGLGHYKRPLDMARNSCLFLLFAAILLRQVVGLSDEHMAVKVVDSAFWITVINAALVLSNVVIFRPSTDPSDWRAKTPKLLIDIGRLLVVAVGAALVVSHVWGADLRGMLAALGVGSLVIGLALQDTLGNVFSGIAMISSRQFAVGDWIRIGDVEGQVRSINWRTVSVGTLTGDTVVIPNSQIARDRLRIYGADTGWMRITTDIKVAYEQPPEHVQSIVERAVAATKDAFADPKPTVRIASYEDFSVLYRVSFAVKDYRAMNPARHEFLANLWYIAEREGLVLPARYNHRFDLPADVMRPRKVAPTELAERLHRLGTLQRPREALLALTARAHLALYRKGETILSAGQRSQQTFAVVSGAAQSLISIGGKDTVLDVFAPGDLILFKSLFRGGQVPWTVRASADCEVIAIPLTDLETALTQDTALAHEIERLLVLREESSERTLAKSSNGSTTGRAEDADRVQILRDLFRA